MISWWQDLPALQQIFAGIAIPATVILVIQSLLLLFGVGFGGGVDMDMDGDVDGADASATDGLSLFTVRGIIAFFAVGGWTGMVMANYLAPWIAILLAFIAGTVALFALAYIMKMAMKLQGSGNLDIHNAIGKTGKVYIPIPAKGEGQGKITMMVQERFVELCAVTTSIRGLKTDEMVWVSDIIDSETVMVTPVNEQTSNNDSQGGISQWIQK